MLTCCARMVHIYESHSLIDNNKYYEIRGSVKKTLRPPHFVSLYVLTLCQTVIEMNTYIRLFSFQCRQYMPPSCSYPLSSTVQTFLTSTRVLCDSQVTTTVYDAIFKIAHIKIAVHIQKKMNKVNLNPICKVIKRQRKYTNNSIIKFY